MLGKLIKYELKATWKIMLIILGVFSLIMLTVNIIASSLGYYLVDTIWMYLLRGISSFSVRCLTTGVLITILFRIKSNLFGKAGYIIHSLPVSKGQIIIAVCVNGAIWLLCMNMVIRGFEGMSHMPVFLYDYSYLIDSPNSEIEEMVASLTPIAELIAIITMPLSIVMSMSVGYSFKKYKLLISVIAFVAYYVSFVVIRAIVSASNYVTSVMMFDIVFSLIFILIGFLISEKCLASRFNAD